MKKIVLSAFAALTLGSVANAATTVDAKASKLSFSGQAFIGATYNKNDNVANIKKFEVRRGYFQLKAYLLDDKKSYYRVTLDLKRDSDVDKGSYVTRAKYAYLNLNNVLPKTSLEIGLAHRPWHDYEEHNSWLYRSVSEVLVEDHNGAHLSNSADLGVMAKTRTKYFDSDIGIFNGEGYNEDQNSGNGMSLEWRLTGHLLGTHGKATKTTYFDTSFFGQNNQKHDATTKKDLNFYALHTVYNMPSFLVAAQYMTSTDVSKGKGYSANMSYRLGEDYTYKAFARYDSWTPDSKKEQTTTIVGAAWEQNKNVEWVGNITKKVNPNTKSLEATSFMVTAEVKF